MNMSEINEKRLKEMDLHETIKCKDGEITRVYGGVLYTLIRLNQNGVRMFLAPVFVEVK